MPNVLDIEGSRFHVMRLPSNKPAVIPAQAGIQCGRTNDAVDALTSTAWIPACAGMTVLG